MHLGEEQLELTNFVLGDAVWTADEIEAGELTELKNELVRSPVANIVTGAGVDAGRLIAAGVIDNTYITEAFYVREIGLMANDPDLGEILYLIDPVAAEAPTTVVESNAIHQEIPIRVELIAVSRDQVELVLSESVAYVTASQLTETVAGITALLAGKSAVGHKHTVSDITDFPGAATDELDGLMSATDKAKLDGGVIAAAESIINTRTGEPVKFWVGTQAQYDAITTKDPNTLYHTT